MKRKIGVLLLIVSLLAGCSVSVTTFPRYGNLQGTVQIVDRDRKGFQSIEDLGLIDPQDIVIAPQGYFEDSAYKSIPGAEVIVDGRKVETDRSGRFRFDNLVSGHKIVRVKSSKFAEDLVLETYVEPGATTETRYRCEGAGYYLVIGIEDYPWPEERSEGSRYDAEEMHRVFKNNNKLYGTVRPFNAPLLEGEATKSKIKEMVKGIAEVATPKDYIVIYFSGHMGKDYLLPYDGNNYWRDPWELVITDGELEEWLRPFKGHATLILEGPDSSSFANDDPFPNPQAFQKGKYTVLSSASLGQNDHVIKGGNGLFTHYLIEGLEKPYIIDTDSDGKITAKEIYDYVIRNVPRDSGYKQTPQLWPDNADTVIYSYK